MALLPKFRVAELGKAEDTAATLLDEDTIESEATV
jgi:hypothetical protein